jgi:hypothetical protein
VHSNPRVMCGENPPDILTLTYEHFGGFIVPVYYKPSKRTHLPHHSYKNKRKYLGLYLLQYTLKKPLKLTVICLVKVRKFKHNSF